MEGFKVVVSLVYTLNSISNILCRSYAMNRIGDFVLPALPSSIQLDKSSGSQSGFGFGFPNI